MFFLLFIPEGVGVTQKNKIGFLSVLTWEGTSVDKGEYMKKLHILFMIGVMFLLGGCHNFIHKQSMAPVFCNGSTLSSLPSYPCLVREQESILNEVTIEDPKVLEAIDSTSRRIWREIS